MRRVVLHSGGTPRRRLIADFWRPTTTTPDTTLLYVHGLASVRKGEKSEALLRLAQRTGAGFMRLDMTVRTPRRPGARAWEGWLGAAGGAGGQTVYEATTAGLGLPNGQQRKFSKKTNRLRNSAIRAATADL